MIYSRLIYAYFTWLAVQNFLLPLLSRQGVLPTDTAFALMAAKEALMFLALAALGWRIFSSDFKMMTVDYWALGFTAVLIGYLALSPMIGSDLPIYIRLVSLRSLLSMVLFYFWGRVSYFKFFELRRLALFIVVLHFFVAAFGIIEWTMLPVSFWSDTVGIGSFMLDVKGLAEGWNVSDGLPSNMFRFDVRRAISTYGDPLSLGIASVLPLLICVAVLLAPVGQEAGRRRRTRWAIAAATMSAALFLTVGRESIGAAVLGCFALALIRKKLQGHLVPATAALLLLLAVPQVWDFVVQTVTFKEGSAATHLNFLTGNFKQLSSLIVGKGLGEAGGWAFSLAGVESEVGESSYFELMGQTGLASLICLVGFLASMSMAAYKLARRVPEPVINGAFTALSVAIVVRAVFAIFSPSLFAVVPLASLFFLAGAGFTTMQRLRSEPNVLVVRRVMLLKRAG